MRPTLPGGYPELTPQRLAGGAPAGLDDLREQLPEVTANAENYLVTAPDVQELTRVRLVLEMLTAMFKRHRALFAGTLA